MATKNDVTGDSIQTKNTSDQYRNNYDLIFRRDKDSDKQSVKPTEKQDNLTKNE